MPVSELGWYFRDAAWLWLLLPLAAVGVRAAWQRPRVRLADVGDGAGAPWSWRRCLAPVPTGVEALAVVLAIAALARPVRQVPAPPERLVRDVMVCLDRSSSMAAEDLARGRSRLALATDLAVALLALRPGDRVGGLAFARYPDLLCPPTVDHAAAGELLRGVALVAAEGPEDATGIGAAVAAAAEVLERSPHSGRVLVLVTDGEENVASEGRPDTIAPLHAAQRCAQLGIRVHTIVVGRAAADVDPTAVRQLAQTTGGRAFVATDAAALAAVAREIDALEPTRFAEPRRIAREGFAALLAAAIGLCWLAHGLRRTWLQVLP